ncbi:MAG: Xaa-Pro peptidase family protein [Trueperaceae bacterium]
MSTLGREKSRQALGIVPHGDVWATVTREGSDPAGKLLFDAAVSGEAAFLLAPGRGVLALVANYDEGHVERLGVFDEIRSYDLSYGDALRAWMRELAPATVHLNYSPTDVLCDGLRHGQYLRTAQLLADAVPNARLASSEPLLREVRGVKTAEELRRLRVAIAGSGELYQRLRPELQAGMSEREIQDRMKQIAAELGFGVELGDYGGPLVCINRVGLAHRAPGNDRLEPGDLLILDHALEHEGYHSDLARTVYLPRDGEREPPPEARRAFESAEAAIIAAFAALRPGVAGHEVDAAACEVHLANGYPEIGHATGHQIGRHVHDGGTILGPRWERYGDAPYGVIREGNVFTIEPTILMSPQPSMLVEENVVVTAGGAAWLSERQTDLWLAGR